MLTTQNCDDDVIKVERRLTIREYAYGRRLMFGKIWNVESSVLRKNSTQSASRPVRPFLHSLAGCPSHRPRHVRHAGNGRIYTVRACDAVWKTRIDVMTLPSSLDIAKHDASNAPPPPLAFASKLVLYSSPSFAISCPTTTSTAGHLLSRSSPRLLCSRRRSFEACCRWGGYRPSSQ